MLRNHTIHEHESDPYENLCFVSSDHNQKHQNLSFQTPSHKSIVHSTIDKNQTALSKNQTPYQFQIIYFNTKNHSPHNHYTSQLLPTNHIPPANHHNQIFKYSIGNSRKFNFISENQLMAKHQQALADQDHNRENTRFQNFNGNVSQPNKPSRRYFQADIKCNNFQKRHHKTHPYKQQNILMFAFLRGQQTQRGLLIDVKKEDDDRQTIDY